MLKKSIEDLLEGMENRETEFDNQIKTMHNQLSHLSEKYYENI